MAYTAVNQYLKFESGLMEGVSSYLVTRKAYDTTEQWRLKIAKLSQSKTVYAGNLSFFVTEEQIFAHFSLAGMVKRVIMGLNRFTKEFCGFAFIEFYDHESALNAKRYLHKTRLGGRIIKVDVDEGFVHDRMYGRGDDGQQVRDNIRESFDADRGGFSHRMKRLQKEYNLEDEEEQQTQAQNGQTQQQQQQQQQQTDVLQQQDQQQMSDVLPTGNLLDALDQSLGQAPMQQEQYQPQYPQY